MNICGCKQFTQEIYKKWLNDIVTANKTNDFEWFHDYNNNFRCKKLIRFWSGKYGATHDIKYKNAISKLKHIIRMAKNKEKWQQYLRENKTT